MNPFSDVFPKIYGDFPHKKVVKVWKKHFLAQTFLDETLKLLNLFSIFPFSILFSPAAPDWWWWWWAPQCNIHAAHTQPEQGIICSESLLIIDGFSLKIVGNFLEKTFHHMESLIRPW